MAGKKNKIVRHQCELKKSPAKRSAADELADTVRGQLPAGLARPALRALAGAGYTRLGQFTQVSEQELLQLHGMGPNAVERIRAALAEAGLSFRE